MAVEGRYPVAALREIDGDPSGSRAYLENRIACLLGQGAPQRQIGRVAPALEVVPDRAQLRSLQNSPV
jgi:hypothetical protein